MLLKPTPRLNAHDEVLKQANIAAYKSAFPGADGIASTYKDFITNTILPQINAPPKYLTNLWTNRIQPDIANAKNLRDVGTDSTNNKNPGKYLPEWTKINNLITAHETHYNSAGSYSWDYTFAFSWNAIRKRSEGLEGRQACSIQVTPTPTSTSDPTSFGTDGPSSSSQDTPSPSPSASSSIPLSSIVKYSFSSFVPISSPFSSIFISSSTPKPLSSSTSSSAPALPTECPSGCECVEAESGGCNCLCS